MKKAEKGKIDQYACSIATATGTTRSIIFHTVFIVGILCLYFVGVEFNTVLLILTTILSVEAIYIGIFNQIINNEIVEQSPDIEL